MHVRFGARAAAPDSAEACFRLGSELAQSGQLDQAIALLRRAVELAPHGAAYHNLATAATRRRRSLRTARRRVSIRGSPRRTTVSA